MREEIEFIGHTVSAEGIKPSKSKVAVLEQYPTPKNVDNVRSFYDLASFYREFVYRFAEIAERCKS